MNVSVVLPVFNGARTIARAVKSILAQTLRDLELIVVNDGSTDDTLSIVRQFKDRRLKLVDRHHRGVIKAANTGTRLAQADLIARMDADDFSYPHRLKKQVQLLGEHRLDAVGCQVRILDANHHSRASMQRYARWINEETLTSENISAYRFVEFPLVNPTILARRDYFELERKIGKIIHGVTVQHTSALSKADGTPLIIAVGAESARPDILPQILAKNFQPGRDAWFVV